MSTFFDQVGSDYLFLYGISLGTIRPVPYALQIWIALRDTKEVVREAAAEALGACLQLVAERENGSLFKFYHKTFEEAQQVREGSASFISLGNGGMSSIGFLVLL